MGKAIISNKIYLDMPFGGFREIENKLTYKIVPAQGGSTYVAGGRKLSLIETVRAYTRVSQKIIAIPQGRQDLIPDDYEIVDKRVYNKVPFPLPNFKLNEHQQPVYDLVNDSCMINAMPGWGKTFTALWISRKLSQKTLIIVHTVALRDQWADEVEKMFGTRPGIIGSGIEDTEDHFIVIANIQTFNKVVDKYIKEFGTVIVDECHHTTATTFTTTLEKMHARYRIGLSGTLIRKDGKHILFENSFGQQVYKPPKSNTVDPRIQIMKTGVMLTPGVPWVNKMNDLLYSEEYQQLIADLAIIQIAKGHKVLITASRVEFLERVHALIDSSVLITGSSETKSAEVRKQLLDKVASGEKNSVVASRAIFTEGISLNELSCVILAEPTSNKSLLEQLIGRIMRIAKNKIEPLVVDLHFAGPDSRAQNNARIAFYLEKGWIIEQI